MNPDEFTRRRIFKYELDVLPRFMVWMPKGAEILSVGRQGSLPYLWASVDQTRKLEQRMFRSVTTGEVFNEERLKFIGHIQLGGEMPKEAWYEWFIWEIDLALPQLVPDPIEDRFLEDMAQARAEAVRAVSTDKKPELVVV
jgi:hypothetical protein